MKERKMEIVRPKGVPDAATWNKDDKLWQLGAFSPKFKKKQVPSGQWHYWSKIGSLVCVAHFDENGSYDGSIECFHPDGSLASRGFWKNGSRCGHFVFIRCEGETDQAYPANHETWRYEFDSNANWEEHDEHWYLKDGTECTSDGRSLAEAFDLDVFFLNAEPDNFVQMKLPEFARLYQPSQASQAELAERFQERERERETLVQNLQEIWGVAPPALVDTLYWLGQVQDDQCLQTSGPATVRRFDGNIWQALITNPYENINEEIAGAFMGAVKLGRTGDSDGIWGTLFSKASGLPHEAIYQWSHDTYCIDDVLALSYDDFAFQVALCQGSVSERLSLACEEQGWAKLAGRVATPYHLSGRIADSDAIDFEAARHDRDNLYRRNFWRSYWIIELLKAPSYFKLSQFKETIFPGCFDITGGAPSFSQGLALGLEIPPVAINILFTLFFLSEDERLKEAAAVFKGSKAKIVRDLVELLDEVGEGLVLDSYGEKIDLLERRKLINKQDAIESCHGEVQTEDPLCHLSPLNRLVLSYLLENNKNAGQAGQQALFQEALWFLQERDSKAIEEFERAFWRLLEQGKPAPLGLCFAISDKGCLTPTPDLQNAVRQFLTLTDVTDQYFIKRTIACLVIAAGRDPFLLSYAGRLIKEIEAECAGLKDFEARMALSSYDQILKELMKGIRYVLPFLEQKQIEESGLTCKSLLALQSLYIKNYSFENATELLITLIALGEEADRLLPLIRGLLSANDSPPQIASLLAIENLIDRFSEENLREFATLSFRNPDENDSAVTLAYGRAGLALSKRFPELLQSFAIEEILENVAELSCYGEERWLDFRLLLCDTALKHQDLPLDKIEPLLLLPFAGASLHRAWQKVLDSRQPAKQASGSTVVSLPFLVCHGLEQLARKQLGAKQPDLAQFEGDILKDPQFLESLLPLLDRDDLVGLDLLFDLLSEAPLRKALFPLQQMVLKLRSHFRAIDPGSSLPQVLSSAIRALTRHIALFSKEEVNSPQLGLSIGGAEFLLELLGNEQLAEPVLQEVSYLSISSLASETAQRLVEALIKIALGDRGWRRYKIAVWLSDQYAAISNDPDISKILSNYKVDQRKLKTWQK
ncbi:MAG: hypothetical protein J0M35_11780 [Candidatus Obscuribacter phosphatis]|uniref:Uncharacterized protein n=1 Tax=Candidatus Obscuribacter phosphatis TaxID=1906157 RepID=A0A8J7PN33_9BACT|nr:hypothetical protein [Candidatus Obscuribacter phosphatis]